jgi:GTPase SAR1 family protein
MYTYYPKYTVPQDGIITRINWTLERNTNDDRVFQHISLFQVVIVGNGAVGKSSMIQRYCRGVFTKAYKKTIGVDFLEKRMR